MAVRAHGKLPAAEPGAVVSRGRGRSGRAARARVLRAALCTLCDTPILAPDEPYSSPFGPICIFCLEDVVPEPDTEIPEADS